MPFSKLGLAPAIVEGVKAMGYVDPTPIQLRAIPLVLAGKDVIGSAQTGDRQDRRVRPAHPLENRPAQRHRAPRAHLGADPRTRRAGGDRLS